MHSETKLFLELFGLFLLFLLLAFPEFRGLFKKDVFTINKKRDRSTAIDFLRGIAMTGIVAIHVDSYFQFFHPKDEFIGFTLSMGNLSRFSVPAFIISSGFFLNWKGLSGYTKPKFLQLIVPYVIIAIVGYFIKYPIGENLVQDFVYKLFLGKVYEPYYYVPLLIQFYILFALLLKNFEEWGSFPKILLLILTLVINFISNHYFKPTTEIGMAIENISFTNFIFFFVFGLVTKKHFLDTDAFKERINSLPFAFLLVGANVLYIGIILYQSISVGATFTNHFLFYPISMFLFLYWISILLEEKEGKTYKYLFKIFSYIGKNSLAVFLLHPIVIHFMHSRDSYFWGGKGLSWFVVLFLNLAIPLSIWWVKDWILSRFQKESR